MYIPNFPTPTQRVVEYEKLGYGMFLHYGLYSELGRGEWVYHMEKHDMKEYEKLAEKFTAKDFDAEKIVLAAKAVGCKYVNLTTTVLHFTILRVFQPLIHFIRPSAAEIW